MSILISILIVVTGFIILILLIALFVRKQHYVRREIIINAPLPKVFDYIKFLKNQDTFNKDAMAGEDRDKEFKGTDGTVGFIYAWAGDKNAGVGEKEIMNIVENKKVEMEIRFVKPMHAVASIVMETEAISPTQTKVYWTNGGKFPYPLNIMIPIMEKNVAKGMDESLNILKGILEK
jgi:hypothetical protein